jgi:hypothetical protein
MNRKEEESLFFFFLLWVLFWSRWFARFFLDEQMNVSGEEEEEKYLRDPNTLCIEPIDVVGRRGGNR